MILDVESFALNHEPHWVNRAIKNNMAQIQSPPAC